MNATYSPPPSTPPAISLAIPPPLASSPSPVPPPPPAVHSVHYGTFTLINAPPSAPPPLPSTPVFVIDQAAAIWCGISLAILPITCAALCICARYLRRRRILANRASAHGQDPTSIAPPLNTHGNPHPHQPPPMRRPAPQQSQQAMTPAERALADALERERIVALKALPTFHWNSRNQPKSPRKGAVDECVLCIEPFKNGATVRRLPCGHHFHKDCIDKWLIGSQVHMRRACPLCKADPVPNITRKKAAQMLEDPAGGDNYNPAGGAPAAGQGTFPSGAEAAAALAAGGELQSPPRVMQPSPVGSPRPTYVHELNNRLPTTPASAMRAIRNVVSDAAAMGSASMAAAVAFASGGGGSRFQRQRTLIAPLPSSLQLFSTTPGGGPVEGDNGEEDMGGMASPASAEDPAAVRFPGNATTTREDGRRVVRSLVLSEQSAPASAEETPRETDPAAASTNVMPLARHHPSRAAERREVWEEMDES